MISYSSKMWEIWFVLQLRPRRRAAVCLLSATEGEDKPLKYPTIFNSSDVAIISKMDMAEAAEFDLPAARRNIESVRPGMKMFEVSSKTGVGMENVVAFLRDQLSGSREEAEVNAHTA